MQICMEFSSSFNLQLFTKKLRVTLVFMWNSALRGKFNFYFSKSFLLVLTKFSFWQEDWALGCYSVNFSDFHRFWRITSERKTLQLQNFVPRLFLLLMTLKYVIYVLRTAKDQANTWIFSIAQSLILIIHYHNFEVRVWKKTVPFIRTNFIVLH